jgi:pimeloyl-ACP methyl ester carboxylesterase
MGSDVLRYLSASMIVTHRGGRAQLIDRFLAVTDHRKPRFFVDGFGDSALLEARVAAFRTAADEGPEPIDVRWQTERHDAAAGAIEQLGTFESPAHALLPDEAKTALVLRIAPTNRVRGRAVVWLAATNDEGFTMRRKAALPLARRGITSLLLENPFYGARRPRGQARADLRTVVDQATMNGATVREAKALLGSLATEHAKLVVAGFSMGGQMAALVATSYPGPLGTVAIAAGETAVPIFLDGVLERAVHWDVLAREAGSREAARTRLAAVFDAASLRDKPLPVCPEAALLLAGDRDGYVPASSARALQQLWPGSELRWLRAGHASLYLFHREAWRRAVLDSFARLPPTRPRAGGA